VSFYDPNCETVTEMIFFVSLSIIYKRWHGIYEPINSKFDNKIDILHFMIFVRYCLDGPNMLDDALMRKLVVALNAILI
jgi:hypothetical protein